MPEHLDTIVIGAGQAGLAASHFLTLARRHHLVLERGRIAERWHSERWDSLRFQFENATLRLPGKTYSGNDPQGFAHHSEITRFITDYAAQIAAPVRAGVTVTRLASALRTGVHDVQTTAGAMTATNVVIATGPFQRPRIPTLAGDIPAGIQQLDPARYRNPHDLPPGAVLVVGSGASGCQIADELNKSGRKVFLSASMHRRVPRRYRGQDMLWWFDKLGRLALTIDNFPGRKYPPSTVVTGVDGGYDIDLRRSAREGVQLLGRVTAVQGGILSLADDLDEVLCGADLAYAGFLTAADQFAASHDGPEDLGSPPNRPEVPPLPTIHSPATLDLGHSAIGSVIWATGHEFDFGWVDLPILSPLGAPLQDRGVTSCPGVYFLGLHWMHNFKSGLFSYGAEDAAYVVDHLSQRR